MHLNRIEKITCNRELLNPEFQGYKSKLTDDTNMQQIKVPDVNINLTDKISTFNLNEYSWLAQRYYQHNWINEKLVYKDQQYVIFLSLDFNLCIIQADQNGNCSFHSISTLEFKQDDGVLPTIKILNFDSTIGNVIILANLKDQFFLLNLILNPLHLNTLSKFKCEDEMFNDLNYVGILLLAAKLKDMELRTLMNYKTSSKKEFNLVEYSIKLDEGYQLVNFNKTKLLKGVECPLNVFYSNNSFEFTLFTNKPFEFIHNEDGDINESDIRVNEEGTKPKYYWMQTKEDITASFLLDEDIPSKQINCTLNKSSFTFDRLNYNQHKWFDNIVESESYWTIQDQKWLTLYLEKKNHGTKWPHLFDIDDNVLEVLDPNELFEIKQSLEKYHAEDKDQVEQRYNLKNPFINEIEVEDLEGDEINLFVYNENGYLIKSLLADGKPWSGFGLKESYEDNLSFALKYDVDALYYLYQENCIVTHKGTFNAMAYVQNSKQDKKLVTYSSDKRWMFIIEFNTYLYIYNNYTNNNYYSYHVILTLPENKDILGINLMFDKYLIVLTINSLFMFNLENFNL